MTSKSFSVNANELDLEPKALDPAMILSGDPQVSSRVLWTSADGRQQRGIWQITPGVVVDIEVNELFVVISDRATVRIEGQEPLLLSSGSVGILHAGDRTIWHVHQTLRKAYHLTR